MRLPAARLNILADLDTRTRAGVLEFKRRLHALHRRRRIPIPVYLAALAGARVMLALAGDLENARWRDAC